MSNIWTNTINFFAIVGGLKISQNYKLTLDFFAQGFENWSKSQNFDKSDHTGISLDQSS